MPRKFIDKDIQAQHYICVVDPLLLLYTVLEIAMQFNYATVYFNVYTNLHAEMHSYTLAKTV